jgi:dephospho-CoA kinase
MEALGVPTLDADGLAREAVAPGSAGLAAVVARFGPGVLDTEGGLRRQSLAGIVFGDAGARADLEAIVHPIVRDGIDRWFAALDARAYGFAVVEIPLLFETGRERHVDAVVVAECSRTRQIERGIARDGLGRAEVEARLAAQWPLDRKAARADYVVSTEGALVETDAYVDHVVSALRRRFPPIR